jgi:hypothetical protein
MASIASSSFLWLSFTMNVPSYYTIAPKAHHLYQSHAAPQLDPRTHPPRIYGSSLANHAKTSNNKTKKIIVNVLVRTCRWA